MKELTGFEMTIIKNGKVVQVKTDRKVETVAWDYFFVAKSRVKKLERNFLNRSTVSHIITKH